MVTKKEMAAFVHKVMPEYSENCLVRMRSQNLEGYYENCLKLTACKNPVRIVSACRSNYKGMTALVGKDDRVYLGKEENYHHWMPAFYDNTDNSLVLISENLGIYKYLHSSGWILSQKEMLSNGLTMEEYKEFAELRHGILSQFETVRELLFDYDLDEKTGKPFSDNFTG